MPQASVALRKNSRLNDSSKNEPSETFPGWSKETYGTFAKELDGIYAEIRKSLGKKDVAYIKSIEKTAHRMEILGRLLIHCSLDPFTWWVGVLALFIHKQINATEIGHSALHGSWDNFPECENLHSKRFKWNTPIDEASWRHEHNILHHQYTNIVGKDPDLNYGLLRSAEQIKWLPFHLLQLGQFFVTAPFFMWVIGIYASGLVDLLRPESGDSFGRVIPDKKPKTILKTLKRTFRKFIPYSAKNFVFWPALAGPFWWKVLAANLTVDVMRGVYSAATIYAGHFGSDLEYYDKDYRPRSKGEWFKSQVEAAHNYEVPYGISVLCGALDLQIEHHLFPQLPPNRLREIQPKVAAVCKRYGVKYQSDSWGKNLKAALARLAKLSLPSRDSNPQGR